jgi:2'-5' RNA ligase
MKTTGKELIKCVAGNTIVVIVPPRELWPRIQSIRTQHLREVRCGPHFSFLDPFVMPDELDVGANLLKQSFKNMEPFQVTLGDLQYFKHKNSSVLYLDPVTEPKSMLDALMQEALQIFPQCDDQVTKGTGGYVPHMTLARFKREAELLKYKQELERTWEPITFTVNEVYVAHRKNRDPFELTHVIPLGEERRNPYFGLGSVPIDSIQARTCIISGFPKDALVTSDALKQFLTQANIQFEDAELMKNPGGGPRDFGIVQFKERQSAIDMIGDCKYQPYNTSTIYLRLLETMLFPDVIGGCCTLK